MLTVREEPIQPGFMRNGFFAWPARLAECFDCKVHFRTTTHADRCQICRPKHKKKWRKEYDRKRRAAPQGGRPC